MRSAAGSMLPALLFLLSSQFAFSQGGSSPCDDSIELACGVEYNVTIEPGAGVWENYTGVTWTYPGKEVVFEFTAPLSGEYLFYLDQGDADADFILMDACNPSANNLTPTASGYWPGLSPQTGLAVQLQAGVTYYLLTDVFTSTNPGTTVTVEVGCATTGVAEHGQDEWTIYPNPVHDVLFIRNGGSQGTGSVSVHNAVGQTVLVDHIDHGSHHQINVQGLSNGLYHMRIVLSDGTIVRKKFEVVR